MCRFRKATWDLSAFLLVTDSGSPVENAIPVRYECCLLGSFELTSEIGDMMFFTWYVSAGLTWCVSVGLLVGIANASALASGAIPSQGPNQAKARERRIPDLAAWHERLKDVDPQSPSAATLVQPLIEIVRDERLRGVDREPFAAYLGRVGSPAVGVVPILASYIRRRSETSDYIWATRALALMGEPAGKATPELIELLRDSDVRVEFRQSSIAALARIGAAHEDAIPALLELLQLRASAGLNSQDAARLRTLGTEAIYVIGPDAHAAVPLLIRLVRDSRESESLRRNAVAALGAVGQDAAMATTALAEELISGKSASVRDEAAKALVQVSVPRHQQLLVQLLRHRHPEVRWRMAFSLRETSSALWSDALSSALAERLEDEDSLVRIATVETSVKVFGPTDPSIQATIQLLADERRSIRIRAKRILLSLQPLQKKHIQAVEDLSADQSGRIGSDIANVGRLLGAQTD